MTDRIATLTVVLTDDMRTDDVQEVINAISQNRYVESVTIGEPVNTNDHIARARVKMQLFEKLREVLLP
jgi:hypothetical protein